MDGQRGEEIKAALRVSEGELNGTTGRVCKKSPPRTAVTPPNKAVFSRMSCKVRSTASNARRFCIEHSSHIRRSMSRRVVALSDRFDIEQVEDSSISIGIFSVE